MRHKMLRRLVLGLIASAWLLSIGLIALVGYQAATLGPRDIGAFVGNIVAGYNAAAGAPAGHPTPVESEGQP